MSIRMKETVQGNCVGASKLITPRTINGTNFDGTANITTASWGTARTITIGNSGKSVNGAGNVSYSLSEIGAAASNHTHTSLKVADTRSANTAPSALDSVFSVDFKNRSTINNAPGAGTYNGLIQFAPWNDTSGGNGYQMSYGYSGTVPYLGIRTADLNSSSWGPWYEIYHSGRKPSKSDVGLSNVQNWTATSATNDSSTSKYATAAGVKAAYDKANSAYTMASNSPSLYTYECDFSSSTVYDITLPSGFTRSNAIIIGAMLMNSTNTGIEKPLIVGMDIAIAPFPPGTPDDKFAFYHTGGTINQKVRVVIMKVGRLYK